MVPHHETRDWRDWAYEHRPRWLGAIARWLFWNTSRFPSLSPHLMGLSIGRRPRQIAPPGDE